MTQELMMAIGRANRFGTHGHHADGGMPRDERGWRVAPAPDGRGAPEAPAPRPPHRSPWFVWLVVLLLALNFGSALLVRPAGQPRVRVPFSPYFISAVENGRIASIASTGNTIQGTFKVAVRYPVHAPQGPVRGRAHDPVAPLTTQFSTEVPTFWNDNQLTALLQAHGVLINASSPTHGGSLVGSLLFGLGPTLLLVGLFIAITRRATKGGVGGWGARELRSLKGTADRSGDDQDYVCRRRRDR